MTETTFSQANPAFAPNPHTDDPTPEVDEVVDPQPVDEPVDEAPTVLKAGFDPVGDLVAEGMSQEDAIQQIADENGLELADDEEEEPPADEE
jgi:hypothetical protein